MVPVDSGGGTQREAGRGTGSTHRARGDRVGLGRRKDLAAEDDKEKMSGQAGVMRCY